MYLVTFDLLFFCLYHFEFHSIPRRLARQMTVRFYSSMWVTILTIPFPWELLWIWDPCANIWLCCMRNSVSGANDLSQSCNQPTRAKNCGERKNNNIHFLYHVMIKAMIFVVTVVIRWLRKNPNLMILCQNLTGIISNFLAIRDHP